MAVAQAKEIDAPTSDPEEKQKRAEAAALASKSLANRFNLAVAVHQKNNLGLAFNLKALCDDLFSPKNSSHLLSVESVVKKNAQREWRFLLTDLASGAIVHITASSLPSEKGYIMKAASAETNADFLAKPQAPALSLVAG